MTSEKFTAAGNLLAWVWHLQEVFDGEDRPACHLLNQAFGDDPYISWTFGLKHFEDLCVISRAGLHKLEVNKVRYDAFFSSEMAAITTPLNFTTSGQSFRSKFLTDIVVERLENIDSLFRAAGNSISVEKAEIDALLQTIGQTISAYEEFDTSEIVHFILNKLKELYEVVDRYRYYGASGVENIVNEMCGKIIIKSKMTDIVDPKVRELISESFSLSKRALDLAVYAHSTADALSWSGIDVFKLGGF